MAKSKKIEPLQDDGADETKGCFTVLSPLRHNGRLYLAGESVRLQPDEAEILMIGGVVGLYAKEEQT